jgi:hypothetical protein
MNFQEALEDFDQFKHDLSLWAPWSSVADFLKTNFAEAQIS